MNGLTVELQGEQLTLHHSKSIYWPSKKILLLADLHLGKSAHFRKEGMAIPDSPSISNLAALNYLLKTWRVDQVIFLGDLFHSRFNLSWERFGKLLHSYPDKKFILVSGNHDILHQSHYEKYNIKVLKDGLVLEPFVFTHIPMESNDTTFYNLAGHIHPGVRMRGKAYQSVRLPCFYFGKKAGIMPAFGKFTGYSIIRPKKDEQVYVIVDKQVMAVQ